MGANSMATPSPTTKGHQMTTIGQNIYALRKKRKLTQKQLANRVGMSKSYLCEIELNRKIPSILVLNKIAVALRTNLKKIL